MSLTTYAVSIVPRARSEIRRWAAAAAAIPDPTLRQHATNAIAVDAGNAEAVAAFAAMTPRCQRPVTVELLVAYQILVDYVDTLGERVCADQLLRGLQMGLALAAALAAPAASLNLDSLGDDGGYLAGLVVACRQRFWQLPSAASVQSEATVAAVRCAHALAHTHTATHYGRTTELREWSLTEGAELGYTWWEIAAGGNSSIAILALLAAAADPLTTSSAAATIAAAYWPHVCVMSTMLDSLVDYERDTVSGEFSFVSQYRDQGELNRGLIRATEWSLAAARPLRHSHTHMMIVCGVAGYYDTCASDQSLASQLSPRLIATLGPGAMLIVLLLRTKAALRRVAV